MVCTEIEPSPMGNGQGIERGHSDSSNTSIMVRSQGLGRLNGRGQSNGRGVGQGQDNGPQSHDRNKSNGNDR